MEDPNFITVPWPTDFEHDYSGSNFYETAVWINQDYWLEAFDGKSGHVVVPSESSLDWGFEEQDDVVYWVPYEDGGPDVMHQYNVDQDVLFSVLGADHPFIKYDAEYWDEKDGKLFYSVDTIHLQLSDHITKDDMWNIVHATMKAKAYVGMRCLTICSPYYHPDCLNVNGPYPEPDFEMPAEQYAIACGLEPTRTHVDTHWTAG